MLQCYLLFIIFVSIMQGRACMDFITNIIYSVNELKQSY